MNLDEAILAEIAAETISRDRVRKLIERREEPKIREIQNGVGQRYLQQESVAFNLGAKRREAKLALDTRLELLSKIKAGLQELSYLYDKTAQHHAICSAGCQCPALAGELESHYKTLHEAFTKCYSQIGKLGKLAYGAE